ncbi:MAG: protein kinase [Acidobacteria bacterium]|nr:protein kinase [Acidobacteriota bacterium]
MRHCLLCSRQYADAMQYCPHDGTALPPPDNLVGKVLDGKYRIDALHGSGGMGAVYRATQVNLERTVALKVVRGDFLKDAIVTERFKREALAVARLKHPHIVTVYDFGIVQEGGAYLVMEFLEGRTLRIEIQNRSKLPIGPAVDIMRQICSAVHAAHSEGIIHRDLKPDNIFLESTRDGSVLVKILDFGVAKLRQNTADLARSADLTMSGMMLGTPIYMSPEQCQGEPFDARADIYSLGCVFYEMVAGRPPFLGNSPSALIIKHASESPKPPSTHSPTIPQGLENAILKALEKNPGDRFQTAMDLGRALAAVWVPLDTQTSFPPVADQARSTSESPARPKTEMVKDLAEELFPDLDIDGEVRHRLAVLPFRNVRKDESVEFLTFAIADSVITELSSEPTLVVRPSAAVEQYRDAVIDQAEISRRLDVDLLVTGSFLKQGNAFQLNAQLVDVAGNEIVWRQRVNGSCDDLFALQDHVVDQVAGGIRATLCGASTTPEAGMFAAQPSTPVPHTPIPAVSTPSHAVPTPVPAVVPPAPVPTPAREFDSVAVNLLDQATEESEHGGDRKQAIERLERAVALEPDLAAAWALLATNYHAAGQELSGSGAYSQKAHHAAERALALSPDQLGRTPRLARILVEGGRAEDIARSASALLANPEHGTGAARFALGYACRFGGLLDRALREFRATAGEHKERVAHQIATIYLQKQLYPDALRVLDEANATRLRVSSVFVGAVAWALMGNTAGAKDTVAELSKAAPSSVYTLMGQVLVARLEGRNVGPLLGWLSEIETTNGEVHCALAQVHAFAGDAPTAVERFRQAVSSGYFNYPYFQTDPLLASIRSLPEAKPALESSRLRHEQFGREFGR